MNAAARFMAHYEDVRRRLGCPMPARPVRVRSEAVLSPPGPEPERIPEPPPPQQRLLPAGALAWADFIVAECAAEYGVPASAIRGRSRARRIMPARFAAYYRVAAEVRLRGQAVSLPWVGRYFGRDHTTILHGIRCHAERNGLPPARGPVPC